MAEFIECTSLNVSYDITGVATISYSVIADSPGLKAYDELDIGGKHFVGYVTSAAVSVMPRSESRSGLWYQTQVNLIALTA